MNYEVFNMTGRAFADQKRDALNTIRVNEDGTVRVLDRVATYFTTCHQLTPNAIRRARREARKRGLKLR